MGGRHLLDYFAANIEALRLKRPLHSMMTELVQRVDRVHPEGYANEVDADQAYGELGWKIVMNHPYLFLKQNMLGMIKLLAGTGVDMLFDLISGQLETDIRMSSDSPTITGHGTSALLRAHPWLIVFQILYWIELAVLYGLCAWGLRRLWNAGYRAETLLIIEIGCYFLALTSHVGYYRFRLPLMPLLAAGAAAGASRTIPERLSCNA
jgi:hypothetical protein